MKHKLIIVASHVLALLFYLGLILPLLALFIALAVVGSLLEMYYRTYKFIKKSVFGVDTYC